MAAATRLPPHNKTASLFVTCLVDMLRPQIGLAAVRLLEHLNVDVVFPADQTCCGQPAYNAGYWDEARRMASHFLDVFDSAELIVAPSGSCTAMVRHEYPRLFADEPAQHERAVACAQRTWELTELIVDGFGVDQLDDRAAAPAQFAFHDGCHGLRLLGIDKQPRALVAALENSSVVELEGHDVCCGFGGLFSVKMAAVSGSMLQQKMAAVEQCPAQVLCADYSCMLHINGGLEQNGSAKRVRHVAELLAERLQ